MAPIKAAVLPLMKKEGMPEMSREIVKEFVKAGIVASYDETQSIGKRYAKHDEIGTPFCITIDHDSIKNGTITLRDRDTTKQVTLNAAEVVSYIADKLK